MPKKDENKRKKNPSGYWHRVFKNIQLVGGMTEWELVEATAGVTSKCELCGHEPLYYNFIIKNINDNRTMIVGSECIVNITNLKDKQEIKDVLASLKAEVWFNKQENKKEVINFINEISDIYSGWVLNLNFKALKTSLDKYGFISKGAYEEIVKALSNKNAFIESAQRGRKKAEEVELRKKKNHKRANEIFRGLMKIYNLDKITNNTTFGNLGKWYNSFIPSVYRYNKDNATVTDGQLEYLEKAYKEAQQQKEN